MEFIDLKAQYSLISEKINQRIQTVLSHGRFIMGPEVGELEAKLSEYIGVRHSICVSSGTDALLIALMAVGVGPGDEVITTPFTFIATAETISLLGAKPVFVDIDPATYNIDPSLIGSAITEHTKAIVPVSLYGQCADLDRINAIAKERGIVVIEDGAQSFGAEYKGGKSCSLSTIGTASFFPAKPLGCYGDGGACFTDDDALAEKIRQIKDHGQSQRYKHTRIGINGRMDTIQAAILLEKLAIFPSEIDARAKIGARYIRLLDGVTPTPYTAEWNTHVYAQFTVQVNGRDTVQKKLMDSGIPTAVHYPVPLNLQPAFDYLNKGEGSFPVSESVANKVISLPMSPYLTESDQDKVVETLIKATS